MSVEVRHEELVVFFHHGESNRWTMPHRTDKDGIRKVRAEAVEFVMKNDATGGLGWLAGLAGLVGVWSLYHTHECPVVSWKNGAWAGARMCPPASRPCCPKGALWIWALPRIGPCQGDQHFERHFQAPPPPSHARPPPSH